jgi:uncharacterized protein (TIGR02118 family)
VVKFSIMFRKPADPEAFEQRYNEFLALVERMPDIQRRQVNSVFGSPLGESPYYRILEVYFTDSAAMNSALLTPAGQEAGGELLKFGSGTFEMFFAEVYEESGGQTPRA